MAILTIILAKRTHDCDLSLTSVKQISWIRQFITVIYIISLRTNCHRILSIYRGLHRCQIICIFNICVQIENRGNKRNITVIASIFRTFNPLLGRRLIIPRFACFANLAVVTLAAAIKHRRASVAAQKTIVIIARLALSALSYSRPWTLLAIIWA